NVGPGTRNCLDDADCGVGNTCVDKPLDYGISSGDVNKVHFDPGWLADGNLFGNQSLACATALPIRELERDPALGFQTVALDPRPAPGSPLLAGGGGKAADPGVTPAAHQGGFGSSNWADDWTQSSRNGYYSKCGIGGSGTAVPDEVAELSFRGKDELRWTKVGDSVTYDVLRSTTADSFAAATSLEIPPGDNVHNRQADASASPGVNTTYYFVVRALNDCGNGSIGTFSNGAERIAP
ncbi:MAG TPA: hypothetical protein VD788_14560, partial [Candidatus Polarisedimenticolaceae bacterium]|nr:hypothetical protein [Candidatus Polarisedimenticolaceae bacterium]